MRNIKISEEISKKIEEDYVISRKNSTKIDIDALQKWIIIGKILSSIGNNKGECYQFEDYIKAKELENKRTLRIS